MGGGWSGDISPASLWSGRCSLPVHALLVFFGWTAAEAVFLYHKLVIVLGTTIDHYVWKAGAIIWRKLKIDYLMLIIFLLYYIVAPLAITAISVGLSYQYYINPY